MTKRNSKQFAHSNGKVGGYLVGRRHSEGGIKGINTSTGQPIEVEADEVIITRGAVLDPTKREFEGQMLTNKEILSRINQRGGGVAFAEGGEVPSEVVCTGARYQFGGTTTTDYNVVKRCGCNFKTTGAPATEREISIDDILLTNRDGQSLEDAIANVKKGKGSRTEGKILVHFRDGKYEIADGFHRVAQAIVGGDTTIKADISSQIEYPDATESTEEYERGGTTDAILAPLVAMAIDLNADFHDIFKNNYFIAQHSANLHESVQITFAVEPKEKWPNGIFHNSTYLRIYVGSVDEKGKPTQRLKGDKVSVETTQFSKERLGMLGIKALRYKKVTTFEDAYKYIVRYFREVASLINREIGKDPAPVALYDKGDHLQVRGDHSNIHGKVTVVRFDEDEQQYVYRLENIGGAYYEKHLQPYEAPASVSAPITGKVAKYVVTTHAPTSEHAPAGEEIDGWEFVVSENNNKDRAKKQAARKLLQAIKSGTVPNFGRAVMTGVHEGGATKTEYALQGNASGIFTLDKDSSEITGVLDEEAFCARFDIPYLSTDFIIRTGDMIPESIKEDVRETALPKVEFSLPLQPGVQKKLPNLSRHLVADDDLRPALQQMHFFDGFVGMTNAHVAAFVPQRGFKKGMRTPWGDEPKIEDRWKSWGGNHDHTHPMFQIMPQIEFAEGTIDLQRLYYYLTFMKLVLPKGAVRFVRFFVDTHEGMMPIGFDVDLLLNSVVKKFLMCGIKSVYFSATTPSRAVVFCQKKPAKMPKTGYDWAREAKEQMIILAMPVMLLGVSYGDYYREAAGEAYTDVSNGLALCFNYNLSSGKITDEKGREDGFIWSENSLLSRSEFSLMRKQLKGAPLSVTQLADKYREVFNSSTEISEQDRKVWNALQWVKFFTTP